MTVGNLNAFFMLKAIEETSIRWIIRQPLIYRQQIISRVPSANKTSGYANLGLLADLVCKKLSISFQAFEMKMNRFVATFPGEIKLAPATIRREISGRFQITSVRPRKEILRERLSATLQGIKPPQSQWLEHRYLEDGMRVNGKLVKLIRWETSQ